LKTKECFVGQKGKSLQVGRYFRGSGKEKGKHGKKGEAEKERFSGEGVTVPIKKKKKKKLNHYGKGVGKKASYVGPVQTIPRGEEVISKIRTGGRTQQKT